MENLASKSGTSDALYILGSSDVEGFPFFNPSQKCVATEQSVIVNADDNVSFNTITTPFNQQLNPSLKDTRIPVVVVGPDEENSEINHLFLFVSPAEDNFSPHHHDISSVNSIVLASDQESQLNNSTSAQLSAFDRSSKSSSQIHFGKNGTVQVDLCVNDHSDKASIKTQLLQNQNIPQSAVIELKSVEDDSSKSDWGMKIEDRLLKRDSLLPKKMYRKTFKRSITCDKCKAVLKSPHQYYHHRNSHIQQGKGKSTLWSCAQCGKEFKGFRELRSHELREHGEVRMYPCPHCIHAFPKLFLLDYHIRNVHKGEKKFKCKLCDHKFFRAHDLKMHLNIHFNIKCHICHFCGRQFIHPSNLLRHQRVHTNVKPYLCNDCGRRFSQIPSLLAHQVSHTSGGSCSDCKAKFRSITGLRNHFKNAHNKTVGIKEVYNMFYKNIKKDQQYRLYNCVICAERFRFKKGLEIHEKVVHSNKSFPCKSCHGVFQCIKDFKMHSCFEKEKNLNIQPNGCLKESEDIYVCTNCFEQFNTIENSENHICKVDEDKKICDDKEIEEISITQEETKDEVVIMYINHENENFIPSIPPVISNNNISNEESQLLPSLNSNVDLTNFSQMNNLKGNIEIEVNNIYSFPTSKSPPMHVEGKQISKRNVPSLTNSIKKVKETNKVERKTNKKNSVKQTSDKLFECTQCWKTFSKSWNWRQHLGTHDTSMRRYVCAECGKSFSYRSTYTNHLRSHSDTHLKLRFNCSQCSKSYKIKSSLDQHIKRKHEKQCNYVCSQCSKGFFNKSEYTNHMRIHRKEYPFVCFACGKEFNHLSHLHRHERIHTGERPHKCSYCPKSFIQPVTLRIHMKKHEDFKDVLDSTREEDETPVGAGATENFADTLPDAEEPHKDIYVTKVEDASTLAMTHIGVGMAVQSSLQKNELTVPLT